jgi:MFS family permease
MTVYVVAALSFLMHVGFGGGKMTLSLFALELNASPAAIGLMMSLMALFPTLIAVPLGKLSDRIGVRGPILIGLAGITLAMLLPVVRPGLDTLFVSAMLIGGSFTFYQVAVSNVIGGIGPPEKRSHNYSMLSLGFAGASFLGPLIAGFSIDHFGHRWTFAQLSIWVVVPLLLVLFRRKLIPDLRVKQANAQRGSFVDLLKIRPLRDTFLAGSVLSSAWDLYQFLMPLYGKHLGLSASTIGMVLSAFATAIVIVRVLIPALARRYSDGQLITGAIFVTCLAYLLFPLVSSPLLLACVSFVLGLGVGAGQPLSMTLIYNLSPPGRAGEASGMRVSFNHMTHVAVPLIFGTMGAAAGLGPVFLANGALLLVCGIVSKRSYLK